MIYFSFDDVAARVELLCNGGLEHILGESNKYHAQSAVKELDKLNKRENRNMAIGKSKPTILAFVKRALNGIEIEKGGIAYKLHPRPFKLYQGRPDSLNEHMNYYYVIPC